MLPGPVFTFELLTLARRARYYVLRTVYGFLLLFLIWLNNPALNQGYTVSPTGEMSIAEMAQLGEAVFYTFAVTQTVVILLITPALVAGVIADERRRKTLHYLLASRLSSAEIVLGKLCARSLNVGVLLALGLPMVVMLSLFGGVDPNAVLLFFAASATTVFLLAAVSIAVSTITPRPRDAVISVYLLELLWLFAPMLLKWLFPTFGGFWLRVYELIRPLNEWVGASSPLYVLTELGQAFSRPQAFIETVVWMMGLQLAYGAAFLLLAVFRLRATVRKEGARSGIFARFFGRKARRFLPRPACGADAMWWKERFVARASPLTKFIGAVALLFVMSLLIYGTVYFAGPAFRELRENGYGSAGGYSSRDSLNGWLRFVTALIGTILMIGTACAAASGLTSEREDDTWISLISTPLTASEIVLAKMFGAFWGMRLLLVLWLGFLFTGVVLGAIHPFGLAAEVVTTAAFIGFGCALGTFYSLRARNSARALTATIGTLILLNGVYLLLLIPVRMESLIRLIGVTPFVEGMVLLSYSDVSSLVRSCLSGEDLSNSMDAAFTCFVSVVVHAIAAVGLAIVTVETFDDVLDRPSSVGSTKARRPPRGYRPSKDDVAAILDETEATGTIP
jgi:ABC-type transport system involved in multi-copper enzyme maturation permease subunit